MASVYQQYLAAGVLDKQVETWTLGVLEKPDHRDGVASAGRVGPGHGRLLASIVFQEIVTMDSQT